MNKLNMLEEIRNANKENLRSIIMSSLFPWEKLTYPIKETIYFNILEGKLKQVSNRLTVKQVTAIHNEIKSC
ncbi:hypothetical protein [Bacillus phage SWEP1]|nr:hypothetical protein [Bacillus phage SWEP1]